MLVRSLVSTQFPQWKDLAIRSVTHSGWNNRTFHLGEQMLVRMPSAEEYALQVEKEQQWLPKLAPHLPLPIPIPLGLGKPAYGYPWKWSIYSWLSGETAGASNISNLNDFAADLAQFLLKLQQIDLTNGPPPGPHSFYRGGSTVLHYAFTGLNLDEIISFTVAANIKSRNVMERSDCITLKQMILIIQTSKKIAH